MSAERYVSPAARPDPPSGIIDERTKRRPLGELEERRAYVARVALRLQEYAGAAGVRFDWRIVDPVFWAILPAMERGEATKERNVDMDAVDARLAILLDAAKGEADE